MLRFRVRRGCLTVGVNSVGAYHDVRLLVASGPV